MNKEKPELELGATEFDESEELTDEELELINKPVDELEESELEPESETEPEEDAEPEEKTEEETEEDKKENVMIPKARLDQEIRNRRNIESELTDYKEKELNYYKEQEKNKNIKQEYEAKERHKEQYIEDLEVAFINGDMRKVAEMFSARDENVRSQAIEEMQKNVPAQIQQTIEKEEFDKARSTIESSFSFLKPDSPDFDSDLVDTIVGFSEAEMRKGKSAAVALKDATSKVLLFERPDEVEKFLVKQGLKKPNENGITDTQRLASKISASKNQPPEMTSSMSQNMSIPDFSTMSEEEFDKLSPKELDAYMKKMEDNH